jgi:hypothetical protein
MKRIKHHHLCAAWRALAAAGSPVEASASGTPAAGFAQAAATGGWVDRLTLAPLNPADIGKTAQMVCQESLQ